MTHVANSAPQSSYAAWVGIDWADEEHAVALRAAGSDQLERTPLAQTPEAIDGWAQRLRQRFDGRPIAVCLEQAKGALIYALMKYDHLVLFPLNPVRLAYYRKARTPSGAKDDPGDAALLLRYLVEHRDELRPWRPDDQATRLLRLLVEQRRETLQLRTRLTNQLTEQLKRTFPQGLALVGDDLTTSLAAEFLLRWPSLEKLRREQPETLRQFYEDHGSRQVKVIQQRLDLLARAQPLTTDPAILQAAVLQITLLARLLRDLIEPLREHDRQIAAVMEEHPDAPLFESFPAAGQALAPRLLAAFGTDRDRLVSAAEVQTFSGIAPVTQQSGKSRLVKRRLACPKFLRQTFHEFAGLSIRYSDWALAYYRLLRSKGKGHHAAVRALAYKWIRVLFRCWKNRQPYNEAAYLAALRKQHSPLLKFLPT
jgi:transposase